MTWQSPWKDTPLLESGLLGRDAPDYERTRLNSIHAGGLWLEGAILAAGWRLS